MEEPKKSSKIPIILWTFGIVVIIVIGVIIYVVMTQNSDINANANTVGVTNQNTNATANANAVTNTNIDTSDWLVYSDNDFSFSFQYPQVWSCNNNVNQEPQPYVANRIILCEYTLGKTSIGVTPSISFNILTDFSESRPYEWLVNAKKSTDILGVPIPTEENYIIAGAQAVKVDYQESSVKQPPEYSQGHTVVFIKKNKLFHIYSHDDVNSSQEDVINGILKSFKVE